MNMHMLMVHMMACGSVTDAEWWVQYVVPDVAQV